MEFAFNLPSTRPWSVHSDQSSSKSPQHIKMATEEKISPGHRLSDAGSDSHELKHAETTDDLAPEIIGELPASQRTIANM
jgi:hypothetical protein